MTDAPRPLRIHRFAAACVALAAAIAGAPAAVAQSWNLVHAAPASGAAAAGITRFASTASRAGGDGFSVAVLPSGDARAVLDGVVSGDAPLAAVPFELLSADQPLVAIDEVPFLATNFVDAKKLWEVTRPHVEHALERRGLTLLYAAPEPPRALLATRALDGIGALAAVSVLVDRPALAGLVERTGAEPVRADSMRDALTVAGADVAFASASEAARDSAWEYASHYVHAPAWVPKQLVVVNARALAGLSPAVRDALLDAADGAAAEAWARAERETGEAVQRLRDYGMQTVVPPVRMLIDLERLGRDLLFRWSEGSGAPGAELVERYYAIK